MKSFLEFKKEKEDGKKTNFLNALIKNKKLKMEYKFYTQKYIENYNNFIQETSGKEFYALTNDNEKIELLIYVLSNSCSGSNLYTLFTQDLYSYGVRDFCWYKVLKDVITENFYQFIEKVWLEFIDIEKITDFDVLNDYLIENENILNKIEQEYNEEFCKYENELLNLIEIFSQNEK